MQIINKTPHDVALYTRDGNHIYTFASEGAFRLLERRRPYTLVSHIHGDRPAYVFPLNTVEREADPNTPLPPEQEGVHYIVSTMFKDAYPYRSDLIVPDEMLRREDGSIYGCKAFAR